MKSFLLTLTLAIGCTLTTPLARGDDIVWRVWTKQDGKPQALAESFDTSMECRAYLAEHFDCERLLLRLEKHPELGPRYKDCIGTVCEPERVP